MIKIIIADDHKLFCEGLNTMLEGQKELEVSDVVFNGRELLRIIPKVKPNIILMDINMPEVDGIEASKSIIQQYPAVKIIMVSMYKRPEIIRKLIKLGVHGYVLKDVGKSELLHAIQKVHSGQSYYGEDVVSSIIDVYRSDNMNEILLTPREKDVLYLICQGQTTHQIAENLNISKNTVESHRKNLLSKTGSSNSISLVNFAYKNHLID